MENTYALVLTTLATDQQAGELARSIVSAGLAACVQIQSLRSVYKWEGEIRTEPEWLLLIKTTEDRYRSLEQHIKAHHSYETPEIDRKSTRLNSSHLGISYAVFCLK